MFTPKQKNSVYHPRLMVFCCAVYELNVTTTHRMLNNSAKCFSTSSSSGFKSVYCLTWSIPVKQVCPNGSVYVIHILATPIPQKDSLGPSGLLHRPGRTFGPWQPWIHLFWEDLALSPPRAFNLKAISGSSFTLILRGMSLFFLIK